MNKLYEQGYDAAGASNIGYGYWTITSSIRDGYMPDDSASNREGHTAMKVIAPNMWNNPEASHHSILWPAETVFPIEFFGMRDPWSVSLNPANYDTEKIKDISVTLTRVNDQKKWHFIKQGEKNDGFFTINTENYGYTPFTLIFQPKQTANYQTGDRYRVEVDGLYTKSGKQTTFQFETVFFEMGNQ